MLTEVGQCRIRNRPHVTKGNIGRSQNFLDALTGKTGYPDMYKRRVRTMDRQGLSQARAEVIEKFINLEWLVNAIISQHYFRKVMLPFVLEVLYDEYCSFGLKRRILKKIVRDIDAKQMDNLNRLNTIRNYFAHRGQEIFRGSGVPSEGQLGIVPDPRKLDEPIDFAHLYEDFQRLEPGVAEYLVELYQRLGGEYIRG